MTKTKTENMQLSLFTTQNSLVTYSDMEQAWKDCCCNKQRSAGALDFALEYELKLKMLCNELNNSYWQPAAYTAFIVHKPVMREIFAADFRDRIVLHYIIGKLNPYFEHKFIYDSWACRKAKGTLFAIRRLQRFIRQATKNYTQEAYILKLDIQSFFASIDKNILWKHLNAFIQKDYHGEDKNILIELCYKVIFNNPLSKCIFKSPKKEWKRLPKGKSLMHTNANEKGLPIGNLTSQVFANFYMNIFDHYVKHNLGIRYYGRYVDDFIIVHESKDYLKTKVIPSIELFLKNELKLTLHPKKQYLQHYSKGVSFLGSFVLPYRTYVGKRSKGNFYACIQQCNTWVRKHKPSNKEVDSCQSRINSYLGMMKHHQTYQLRKKIIRKNLSGYWYNHLYSSGSYGKMVRKWKYVKE